MVRIKAISNLSSNNGDECYGLLLHWQWTLQLLPDLLHQPLHERLQVLALKCLVIALDSFHAPGERALARIIEAFQQLG